MILFLYIYELMESLSIVRLLGSGLVMIHVRKSMQRFTTTGLMFRKHFMLTQPAFLIGGLLAGEFVCAVDYV